MRLFASILLVAWTICLSGCATTSDDVTMQGYGGPHNYADPNRY